MTPQEISRSYDSSIVVRRWAGAWIDFIALAILFLGPSALLSAAIYQSTMPLWAGLALVYFPLAEGLTGRSLGKFVSRTKVVDSKGRVPGIGKAIVRTLARLIEVNPFLAGGVPAGIAVLATPNHQRIGDLLAGTFVIKNEDLRRIGEPLNPVPDTAKSDFIL